MKPQTLPNPLPHNEGEGRKTTVRSIKKVLISPLLVEERVRVRRDLRIDQTPTEHLLWQKIRGRQLLGLKFRRQHPIGSYVADFFCPEKKLVIEVDGDVHYFELQQAKDVARTKYIQSQGYTVIRFTTNDIRNNMNGVMDKILLTLTLSPKGEREYQP